MNQDSFRYQTLNAAGKQQEVEIQAKNTEEARIKLRRQGLIPLREINKTPSAGTAFGEHTFSLFRQKVDVLEFMNRLAPLLAANVPLEKALNVMEEGSENPAMLEMLRDFRKKLHEGRSFSSLIEERSDIFPPVAAGLIRTGEEAGCLPLVAGDLRHFLAEQREFRNFVITSSIYPLIVAGVTLAVVLLLFTVFIPQFAQVFEDMHAELPALTRNMLAVSRFLTGNFLFFPPLILLFYLVHRWIRASETLRHMRDALLLKIPVAGNLLVSIQVSTFLQAMSIMTRSHVPLLSALEIAQGLITNAVIRKDFDSVSPKIREGEKLSGILGEIVWLPPGSSAMLKVAEESGDMGEMFERLFQEERSATQLKFKRLLAMLEPLIILVLALLVMTVVLAVFLAVWKMNSLR